MAKHRRRPTRAERRRLEREAANRAAREAGVEAATDAEQRPRFARSRHQLEALVAEAAISNEQARAGARLFLDYIASGPLTHLRMSPYQPGPRPPKKYGGASPGTPQQEAARWRFECACAVLDPLERALAAHTCLCDLPPAAWTPPLGYGRDPPLALLRQALDALVRHYGERLSAAAPQLRDRAA